jgi:hypothetical protein
MMDEIEEVLIKDLIEKVEQLKKSTEIYCKRFHRNCDVCPFNVDAKICFSFCEYNILLSHNLKAYLNGKPTWRSGDLFKR